MIAFEMQNWLPSPNNQKQEEETENRIKGFHTYDQVLFKTRYTHLLRLFSQSRKKEKTMDESILNIN